MYTYEYVILWDENMDYKRILVCVILFSLFIATTSVAFASNDTNIIIDDDSDNYISDEIEDINDEYEYSIWDCLQIEVTPDNEDFNAEDNVVWNVTIKNNANSAFKNLNLALYIVDAEEPYVYELTYLNFTKGILSDSSYFPVSEYLAIGSFNPGETAEIYIQTMGSYPEDAYLMCYFLNSDNEGTGDLSDFEIEDYDRVGYCFDISMDDIDDSDDDFDDELDDSDDDFDDELDDSDDELDDSDDDFDEFDEISDLEKNPSYAILVPEYYIGNDAYQSVQPQVEYGYAIAGKTSHQSESIFPNNIAKNIDSESVEVLTDNIPEYFSSVSDERLINGLKSVNDVVPYNLTNNIADYVFNTVAQSVSSNVVSSSIFNSDVQSENQDNNANDTNNADNNVVKTVNNSSSGINYGIIVVVLIAIICIVVVYKKFN